MSRDVEEDRPRRKKKKKKGGMDAESRVLSYVMGAFLLLLGIGLMVGYQYLTRGPSRLFDLLAAGGAGSFLAGVGLFIQPLDEKQLGQFQNNPNPIEVFGVMPPFWKAWLFVILAGMIAGFVYVTQTTVRIGR